MQRSYLDDAMSVIVSRALPDVRDGLKPTPGASAGGRLFLSNRPLLRNR
jgi:hypothetical protein